MATRVGILPRSAVGRNCPGSTQGAVSTRGCIASVLAVEWCGAPKAAMRKDRGINYGSTGASTRAAACSSPTG